MLSKKTSTKQQCEEKLICLFNKSLVLFQNGTLGKNNTAMQTF